VVSGWLAGWEREDHSEPSVPPRRVGVLALCGQAAHLSCLTEQRGELPRPTRGAAMASRDW